MWLWAETIKLSPHFIVIDVLHVPKLCINLVSITWRGQFNVFRLGMSYTSYDALEAPCPANSTSTLDKIWLYHWRLGHPSFSTLKVMLLSLFLDSNNGNLYYGIRELAKQKHVIFLPSDKRNNFPFNLVHNDIWGPYDIYDIFRVRLFVSFIDDCTKVSWLFLLKTKILDESYYYQLPQHD